MSHLTDSVPDVNLILHRLKQHPDIATKTTIANICGVRPQSLNYWTRVPAEYVRRLERASAGTVTRYEMRPDVFGPGPGDESDLDHVMADRSVA